MRLRTSAFSRNDAIPGRYTADGEDRSPALRWEGVPKDARELALIVEDPDAPADEPFVHWIMYGIPPDTEALPEGIAPEPRIAEPHAVQGTNSFGSTGYRGPAPPKGDHPHHYHFRLLALDKPTGLAPGRDAGAFRDAVRGHVLAEAELVGTYRR
jgi:Raf kinase inhibitor-like YbhB/YbcL family protein